MVDHLQKKYCSSFPWCLRARSKRRSHELDLSSSKELNLSHFMSLTLWLAEEHMVVDIRGKTQKAKSHLQYIQISLHLWMKMRKENDKLETTILKSRDSGHFHPQDLIVCLESPFTHALGSFGVPRSPCIWGSVFHSDIIVFNYSRGMLRGKAEEPTHLEVMLLTLLQLFHLIIGLLLSLIYKLKFIIDIYVQENNVCVCMFTLACMRGCMYLSVCLYVFQYCSWFQESTEVLGEISLG